MIEQDDHRHIAQRLDLLHFQDEAPGMAFWHPRGLVLYRLLEEAARRRVLADGYLEVRTPQVMRRPIWESSGHWDNFAGGMFSLQAEPGREAALKPVSCPGHIEIFRRQGASWRDLPVRLAEFGVVHRDEPGGSLHGLLRLRQFTQDDGHVFCAPEQVQAEVEGFCRSLVAFYRGFGFEAVSVSLSGRPEARFGDDDLWDRAEEALARGAEGAGLACAFNPGEGAFYGPKLEFSLADRLGRPWQCGTIQLDFVMPERFDIHYVDPGDRRVRPAMLHRALYGSLERFLGMLLEHHGGQLPPWLAPVQARVIPIGDDHLGYAREVQRSLLALGLRVEVDGRDESVARRVAEAHDQAVPFMLVVGDREVEARSVSLRRGRRNQPMSQADALAMLSDACRCPLPEA